MKMESTFSYPIDCLFKAVSWSAENFHPKLLMPNWHQTYRRNCGPSSASDSSLHTPLTKIYDISRSIKTEPRDVPKEATEALSDESGVLYSDSVHRLARVGSALEELIHHMEDYTYDLSTESGSSMSDLLFVLENLSLENLLSQSEDDPYMDDFLSYSDSDEEIDLVSEEHNSILYRTSSPKGSVASNHDSIKQNCKEEDWSCEALFGEFEGSESSWSPSSSDTDITVIERELDQMGTDRDDECFEDNHSHDHDKLYSDDANSGSESEILKQIPDIPSVRINWSDPYVDSRRSSGQQTTTGDISSSENWIASLADLPIGSAACVEYSERPEVLVYQEISDERQLAKRMVGEHDDNQILVSILEEFLTSTGTVGVREVCRYETCPKRFDWKRDADDRKSVNSFLKVEYPQPRDPRKQLRKHAPSLLKLIPADSQESVPEAEDPQEDPAQNAIDNSPKLPTPIEGLDVSDGRKLGIMERFYRQKDDIVMIEMALAIGLGGLVFLWKYVCRR